MQIKPLPLVWALSALPSAAQEAPLSAIDWLAIQRNAPPVIDTAPDRLESPVAQSATVPDVEVQSLDAPTNGGVGLLPGSVTGLPPSLWQGSREDDLIRLIEMLEARRPSVPALHGLLHTLMLAEAQAPMAAQGDAFLLRRLKLLYDHGLVAAAEALVERVANLSPALFDQAFDLALLTGSDAALCQTLRITPGLSTDLATRIWCTTRSGDFPHAMTIYQTGVALDQMSDLDAELLLRFLDPQYAETAPSLRPPVRPTPLQFRLFEAIGDALPTAPLPLPFAVVEVSGDSGWRAQLQAAERLARAGALDGNQLLGVYTAQRRAASGGVWDRVEALQRLETALANDDPDAVSAALIRVWPQMRSTGLLVPFSKLFAAPLRDLALDPRAGRIAAIAGLLSDEYETVAQAHAGSDDPVLAFLSGIAMGEATAPVPSDVPHADALRAAWTTPPQPPETMAALPGQNRLGEALLTVIRQFATGADGNDAALTEALRAFRAFGLEDTARRSALQLAILDMEGARR